MGLLRDDPLLPDTGFALATGAPGLLLASIPTGMLAAPGVAGAADIVMRSIRDEIGWWWWDTYKKTWKRR